MNIEKQAKRARRQIVFWRFVGDILFYPPQLVMSAISTLVEGIANAVCSLVNGIGRLFRRMEMAVFLNELDAARRYYLLTDVDLGMVTGEPARYGLMLRPELSDEMQEEWFDAQREIAREDEDE